MRDDSQLVEETLAGRTDAYGELVERYQDRLYSSLYRYMGCAEDAQDVVQDAFVRAFTRLNTFRGSSAFYTWLYRIAFNLAASQLRRRRPTGSLDAEKDGRGMEPVGRLPDAESEAIRRERTGQVHQALAELDDSCRQILVLRELEGCDYEAIGEILDIPPGTVRSRLHRARLKLKTHLAPLFAEQAPHRE